MTQEGQHDGHHLRRSLQAKERCPFALSEGSVTEGALVALFLLAVDYDVAFSRFASSVAAWVMAELGSRVHEVVSSGRLDFLPPKIAS